MPEQRSRGPGWRREVVQCIWRLTPLRHHRRATFRECIEQPNFDGPGPAVARSLVKLDGLTDPQRIDRVAISDVTEDVGTAAVRGDEPVTSIHIPHCNSASEHQVGYLSFGLFNGAWSIHD